MEAAAVPFILAAGVSLQVAQSSAICLGGPALLLIRRVSVPEFSIGVFHVSSSLAHRGSPEHSSGAYRILSFLILSYPMHILRRVFRPPFPSQELRQVRASHGGGAGAPGQRGSRCGQGLAAGGDGAGGDGPPCAEAALSHVPVSGSRGRPCQGSWRPSPLGGGAAC